MAQTYMRNGVWQGFSTADVARDYEDYKGQRQQNAFNAMKYDEAERQLEGRNALQDYMRQNPNATEMDVVSQGISTGAVDPIAGVEAKANIAAAQAKAESAAMKMDTEQLKQQSELLKQMLPAASFVQDQAGYDAWKSSLPEGIAAVMPPQYDPAFMQKNIIDGMAFVSAADRIRLKQGQERNDIARARLDKPPAPKNPSAPVTLEDGTLATQVVGPDGAVTLQPIPGPDGKPARARKQKGKGQRGTNVRAIFNTLAEARKGDLEDGKVTTAELWAEAEAVASGKAPPPPSAAAPQPNQPPTSQFWRKPQPR